MDIDLHYPRTYSLGQGPLTFTWLHGGGHAPGAVLWRWHGWAVLVAQAGQA